MHPACSTNFPHSTTIREIMFRENVQQVVRKTGGRHGGGGVRCIIIPDGLARVMMPGILKADIQLECIFRR